MGALLVAALAGCGADRLSPLGGKVAVNQAVVNVGIYNGYDSGDDSLNRVIYSVHGSNLNQGTMTYMLDGNDYCVMFSGAVAEVYPYWGIRNSQTGQDDHLYIEAVSRGDGYYNALYVTGSINLTLASAKDQGDLYGGYWEGANLLTVCPGGYAGNALDIGLDSGDEHNTTSVKLGRLPSEIQVRAPDACDDNANSAWLYTYSGTGDPLVTLPTWISYDALINRSCTDMRVPEGNWFAKCDYQDAQIDSSRKKMTATCRDIGGHDVLNDDFDFGPCADWVVNCNDGGLLQCD